MTLHPDLVDLLKLVERTAPNQYQDGYLRSRFGEIRTPVMADGRASFNNAMRQLEMAGLVRGERRTFQDQRTRLMADTRVVQIVTDAGYSLLLSLAGPSEPADWRPSETIPEDFYSM